MQVDLEDVGRLPEAKKHCLTSKNVGSGDIDLLCHETSVTTLDKVTCSSNTLPRKNRRKPLHVLKSLPNPAKEEMVTTRTDNSVSCNVNTEVKSKNNERGETDSNQDANGDEKTLDNVRNVRVSNDRQQAGKSVVKVESQIESASCDESDDMEIRNNGIQRQNKALAKKRQSLENKTQRAAKKQRLDLMNVDRAVKCGSEGECSTSAAIVKGCQLRKSARQKTGQEKVTVQLDESEKPITYQIKEKRVDQSADSGDKGWKKENPCRSKDAGVENITAGQNSDIKCEDEEGLLPSKHRMSDVESVMSQRELKEKKNTKQVPATKVKQVDKRGKVAVNAIENMNIGRICGKSQHSDVFKFKDEDCSDEEEETEEEVEVDSENDTENIVEKGEEGDYSGRRMEDVNNSKKAADDLMNVMSVKRMRMRLWNPLNVSEEVGFENAMKPEKKIKRKTSLPSSPTQHARGLSCDNVPFSSVDNRTLPAFKVCTNKHKKETDDDPNVHSETLNAEIMGGNDMQDEHSQSCSKNDTRSRKQQQQHQEDYQQLVQQNSSQEHSEPLSHSCVPKASTGKHQKRKKKSKSLGILAYTSLLKPIQRDKDEIRRGDIVWGRCAGHGWWPGRVMSLVKSRREANVSWSYSNTNSVMPLSHLDLFLPHFKKRFASQKTGGYLKAVREAQQLWEQQFGLL